MKFNITPIGNLMSDNSYPVREGKPWKGMLFLCSDPRYRTDTIQALAYELGLDTTELAPTAIFGGPAMLVIAQSEVCKHFFTDANLATQHGALDIYLVQHTNVCKGLVGRGIEFESPQEEYVGSYAYVRNAIALMRRNVPKARVWGAVLLMSDSKKRFKLSWVDAAPPGVVLED